MALLNIGVASLVGGLAVNYAMTGNPLMASICTAGFIANSLIHLKPVLDMRAMPDEKQRPDFKHELRGSFNEHRNG